MLKSILLVATVIGSIVCQQPNFIQKCERSDPEINECLMNSFNNFAFHLKNGIPELDVDEVEPVVVDEISIAIGNGPDGYRAIFQNINAYGVSNLSVTAVRSDIDTLQFQLTIEIPKIKVQAKYRSSGVLLLVQASGGGEYWGEYDGVRAKAYFKLRPAEEEDDSGATYMAVEQLKMDFNVKNIKMGVTNLANGSGVLEAALNLFINSNAQDLLREMKPSLKAKLTSIMKNFMDKMLDRMPLELWLE